MHSFCKIQSTVPADHFVFHSIKLPALSFIGLFVPSQATRRRVPLNLSLYNLRFLKFGTVYSRREGGAFQALCAGFAVKNGGGQTAPILSLEYAKIRVMLRPGQLRFAF
jgi:hypothetical protein